MLTLDKPNIYRRFDGDLDGWARIASGHDASGITDADWHLIEDLRQGLGLIAAGQASQTFAAALESRLLRTTADEATRQALRALR
ncbi:MAG: hypothetical protein B7Z46_01985 [Hydrogenophilales bacterium 12-64-6]|nr:MAG: hypothetical protein B7Z46_01985 [Hydrogenophilales bacterium 12-64-6]